MGISQQIFCQTFKIYSLNIVTFFYSENRNVIFFILEDIWYFKKYFYYELMESSLVVGIKMRRQQMSAAMRK
jgi:hypothetical protein